MAIKLTISISEIFNAQLEKLKEKEGHQNKSEFYEELLRIGYNIYIKKYDNEE